jgi:DNA polymerase III delta prime subunit
MKNNMPTFISKYKPYFIHDFCFDEKTIQVIQTLIDIDHLNILFVGNSSSGKTSLLYALIREYYGLSRESPFPENNILFINNLKEQGIQYFRNEMKTFCQSHTAIHGKKKLVIVDDIDTINEQSQQVFRNYIDKYKHNIHFISVCTNIQKVIESFQSRMHILQIPQPTVEQIDGIMDKICVAENLHLDGPAKEYLLMISNHFIRVLINYLEKISILMCSVKDQTPATILDLEQCKKICSNISYQQFELYIDKVKQKKLTEAIDILYTIHDYGYSVIDILDYFFAFLKITPLLDEDTKYKYIPFLCKYITVFHNVHEDGIELALFTNNLIALG